MRTELYQETNPGESTNTELEEKIYSRFYIENSNSQILFGESKESWMNARKEKDTTYHLVAKHGYSAIYATASEKSDTALPRLMFSLFFDHLKISKKNYTFLRASNLYIYIFLGVNFRLSFRILS